MKLKISWIIYFLILFVPVEVLFLKVLPVSDNVYGYLRFAVELIVYVLGGLILLRVLMSGKLPLGTNIDKLVLIFIGYGFLVTIVNSAPFLEAFVGIRGLLRYVPLVYVLAFIKVEKVMSRHYFNLLISITIVQVLLTIYQHYFGVSEIWYPRASELEIGGKQVDFRLLTTGFGGGREQGAGIGTFGDSVLLALFLVIVFIVLMASLQIPMNFGRNKKILLNVLAIFILVSIFFTYSRGSVLIALLTIPLMMFLAGKRRNIVLLFIAGVLILSPFLINMMVVKPGESAYINPKLKYTDPISNVMAVFNSDYVDNTLQFSRGLVLTQIGFKLVEGKIFFGYSPAQDFALEKAASKMFGSETPINNLPVINDVYWVAFVIYYGFVGLAIFLLILYRIMKASIYVYKHSPDMYMKVFGLSMAVLILISIPYSMILRTFMFRSFGFYFWVMAGLVYMEWRRLKYSNRTVMNLKQ